MYFNPLQIWTWMTSVMRRSQQPNWLVICHALNHLPSVLVPSKKLSLPFPVVAGEHVGCLTLNLPVWYPTRIAVTWSLHLLSLPRKKHTHTNVHHCSLPMNFWKGYLQQRPILQHVVKLMSVHCCSLPMNFWKGYLQQRPILQHVVKLIVKWMHPLTEDLQEKLPQWI